MEDEKAYQAVKEAKKAVLEGQPKPENCSVEVWRVLKEMYEKSS